MLTGRSYRKPGHNLIQQMGGGFQTPIATASAGASVQHGLSAAGGVYGFYQHCSAADNGNPEFATILKVVAALGLQLHATPVVVKGPAFCRPDS